MGLIPIHPVNNPCVGNWDTQRKAMSLGRPLTDSSHEYHVSKERIELMTSEVKAICSDDRATEGPPTCSLDNQHTAVQYSNVDHSTQ